MSSSATSWPEVTLGQICEFKYGKSLPEAVRSGGHVPVFGSNGQVGSHEVALTTGPTIVIGRKGSTGEVNFSPDPCWPIDTTYYIDGKATQTDVRWLAYRLAALGLTKLNKSVVPGLNREDAYRKRLLLPPLAEQRRIAEVLDRAEALRAKRRAALAQLDTLTQSIFLEMFGDPATNPKRWTSKPLGALAAKFSDGPFGSNLKSEHYTATGVRVVRLQNIGVGEFVDDDTAYIAPDHFAALRKHECLPGDVLVGTLGDPNLRACTQPDWLTVALNKADCVQVRPDARVSTSAFICALLNQPSTERMAHELMRGQTRVRISMGRLRQLNVPVPPIAMQRTFASRIAAAEGLKRIHRTNQSKLGVLVASLQHRAFRGEL